jgi:hypothetical protein
MTDSKIASLVDTLSSSYKKENELGTDPLTEYIVITGRKEFNHAYKIKTQSGKLFAQKLYFVTVELEHHVRNALKYPGEYLCSLFSEYIDPKNVPGHLKDCATNYILTFDGETSEMLENRKILYDVLFNHVLENPLEEFSYKWWNFYVTCTVRNMYDVYFIDSFSEL